MYFGALAVAFAWAFLRRHFRLPERPLVRSPFTQPWVAPLAAVSLVPLFAAQLAIVGYMATHQIASACWHRYPVPVVGDFLDTTGGPAQLGPGMMLVAIAVVQAGLLFLMLSARREPVLAKWHDLIVASACSVLLALAVFAPALTSPDPYLYMAYSRAGFAAYAAAPHVVPASDLPLADWCMRRLLPSAYGPAFIIYLKMILAVPQSAVSQLFILRLSNGIWYLLLLALLRAAGVTPTIVALAAVNPVLLFQYVTNPHNDLIAIDVLVAGIATAQRSAIIASLLVVLAGLFKIPFALLGLVIFAPWPSLRKRVAAGVFSLAATLLLSYLLAGPDYFGGLRYYNQLLAPIADRLQYAFALLVVVMVARAFFLQRFSRIGPFVMPSATLQTLFPWYVIWSLPYALRERTHLGMLFVLLPIVASLMETGLAFGAQVLLYAAVCAAMAYGIVRDFALIRAQRRAGQEPST